MSAMTLHDWTHRVPRPCADCGRVVPMTARQKYCRECSRIHATHQKGAEPTTKRGRIYAKIDNPMGDAAKNTRNVCANCPKFDRANGWCPIRAEFRAAQARACNWGVRTRKNELFSKARAAKAAAKKNQQQQPKEEME